VIDGLADGCVVGKRLLFPWKSCASLGLAVGTGGFLDSGVELACVVSTTATRTSSSISGSRFQELRLAPSLRR
jgi:hypothetical protein